MNLLSVNIAASAVSRRVRLNFERRKPMKKLTSILLVFAIALSCFVFVGCDTEDKLEFFKERKIKRDYIEQFDIRGKNVGDVVLDYYGGNYNGYEIVMLDTECHDPETRTEQIGDVSITYYDSNQLYAWGDEGFYSLDSAYKSGVLSEANLNELVSRFNERVTHFRDTGDVHDYEPAIITSLPKDYFKNSIYFSKYSLKVTLDHKASNENIAPSIDFFGSQYVSKVISSSSNDKHLLDEDYEQQLLVHLHTENSVINLLYVKSQLEKIPGVKKVELVAMMIATKSSNDPYYQNSDDK